MLLCLQSLFFSRSRSCPFQQLLLEQLQDVSEQLDSLFVGKLCLEPIEGLQLPQPFLCVTLGPQFFSEGMPQLLSATEQVVQSRHLSPLVTRFQHPLRHLLNVGLQTRTAGEEELESSAGVSSVQLVFTGSKRCPQHFVFLNVRLGYRYYQIACFVPRAIPSL